MSIQMSNNKSILTFFLFGSQVSYVKAMDWFLLTCLLFVFATLVEFSFVAYRHKTLKDSIPKRKEMFRKLREKMKSSVTFTENKTGQCSITLREERKDANDVYDNKVSIFYSLFIRTMLKI